MIGAAIPLNKEKKPSCTIIFLRQLNMPLEVRGKGLVAYPSKFLGGFVTSLSLCLVGVQRTWQTASVKLVSRIAYNARACTRKCVSAF